MISRFLHAWNHRRTHRIPELFLALIVAASGTAWDGCSRAPLRGNVQDANAQPRVSPPKATDPIGARQPGGGTEEGQSAEDRTVLAVSRAIRRHQLTSLPDDCISYQFRDEPKDPYYTVEVRENHQLAKCGGDPQTSPRLLTMRVMKETGALLCDCEAHPGEFKPVTP